MTNDDTRMSNEARNPNVEDPPWRATRAGTLRRGDTEMRGHGDAGTPRGGTEDRRQPSSLASYGGPRESGDKRGQGVGESRRGCWGEVMANSLFCALERFGLRE